MQPILRPGDSDPCSILVVLPTWVGDFVMATPTLRAIRDRFPRATIVALGEANLADLVRGGSWMDEWIEWPDRSRRTPFHSAYRSLARSLRRRRFDWAVLLPNSFRSALLARLSGVRRRIGYARNGRGWLLTDRIELRHRRNGRFVPLPICTYYADLAEALGCDRPDDSLELHTTPDCDASLADRLASVGAADAHPLVVLCPGAKYGAAKCWPAERYAQVADRLVAQCGARVVVSFGPGEEQIAQRIHEAMEHPSIVFDEPRLTLGELKSLIHRCDLLICNDAGPRHFAKAFGVPVVTIFGPTHPEWTRTSYPAERIVRVDIECGPCQKRICPLGHLECMTRVTPDAVFEAAQELLLAGRPTCE